MRWTCGSVCRNAGRAAVAEHRPLVAERVVDDRSAVTDDRVDDVLALGRVDRAGRVDDDAARLRASDRGARAARAGARAAARRASEGRGGPRARRAPSTERRRARGRSRRARPAARAPSACTTRTPVAPRRRAFCSSCSALASSTSTATTSPASIVALPPGAAQRSSVRSPGCEPTTWPTSWEPRLCGQIRPSASACSSTRSTTQAPGITVVLVPLDRAAHEANGGLRLLVLRGHQRARLVGSRARATTSRRSSRDTSGAARPRPPWPPAAPRRAPERRPPACGARRSRTAPPARGAHAARARPTRSRRRSAGRRRGTRAGTRRGAARRGRAGRACAPAAARASRSHGRASASRWIVAVREALGERPVALVELCRRGAEARSAYAPSSKTRRSTVKAARRAGAIVAHRSPRRHASTVIRRPPSGCTSRGSKLAARADPRAPDGDRAAVEDRAGADVRAQSARTMRTSSSAGRVEVERALFGSGSSPRRSASPSCGTKTGSGSASTPSSSRAATSAARA